jgi:hypothetical protein
MSAPAIDRLVVGERPWAEPAVRAPRYRVDLPVLFHDQSRRLDGSGTAKDASRSGLRMTTAEAGLRVGDALCYVIEFPGAGARSGAVAMCCGRVVRIDPAGPDGQSAVAVTITRHRLQPQTLRRRSSDAVTEASGAAFSRVPAGL